MTAHMKMVSCDVQNCGGHLKWGEVIGGKLRVRGNVVEDWSNSTGSFVLEGNVLYEKKTPTGPYTRRILDENELEERKCRYEKKTSSPMDEKTKAQTHETGSQKSDDWRNTSFHTLKCPDLTPDLTSVNLQDGEEKKDHQVNQGIKVNAVLLHREAILATVTFKHGGITLQNFPGRDIHSSVDLQTGAAHDLISMVGQIKTREKIYIVNVEEQGSGVWHFFENGCILRV
jgi:hypothetical protein